MTKKIAVFLATGCYSGFFPVVSGTIGSIPPLLLAYFFWRDNPLALTIASVVAIAISVWSAGEAEKILGHDSKKIVSDEWAGMFITLILVPGTVTGYLVAFVAFRALDVIKLWPAGVAENLPRGWGVTADDVVAGIQANLVTHGALWIVARFLS